MKGEQCKENAEVGVGFMKKAITKTGPSCTTADGPDIEKKREGGGEEETTAYRLYKTRANN